MRLLDTKTLRGPNLWADRPAIEASIDLAGAWPSAVAARVRRLLREWFPKLEKDAAPAGDGTGLMRDLAFVSLELQRQAGAVVSFFDVRRTAEPDVYKVVFECADELVTRQCLDTALEIFMAAANERPVDLTAALEPLRDSAGRWFMGPSTNGIVQAALKRNIPFARLDRDSLVQLGHGKAQRRIRAAETDRTLAVAEGIAQDKEVTRVLLQAVGVPVPKGFPVADAEEAWTTATEDLGLPVVVKPRYGYQGRGVATNLTTREQVKAAFEAAQKDNPELLVEKHIAGDDYRLLVVNGRVSAASRRAPPHVVGDGRSAIRALVDEANRDPRRGDHHATALSKLLLDDIAIQVLADQGRTPDSVPAEGERVLIRRNANLSTGGAATDVTDLVCPEVARHAVAAASVVGLDVAGIDVVAGDISRPLEEQGGVVVEVNAAPGLRMHLAPTEGKPRDVGAAIVDMLFPDGGDGRIPIAAVTGTNGKTTVTRFLAHLVKGTGRFVGMTCTDGIYLNGRRVSTEDCSGPISAGLVLMNPDVEAAVFETARGGILRAGLGFDRCRAAVVTNIAEGDHLGQNGVQTAEDLANVKATIVGAVSPDGAAVLNAADPLVTMMAPRCQGRIVYFALDGTNPVIVQHRANGGAALFVNGPNIVLAEGAREEPLMTLDRVPITFDGKVAFETENALAALAGAWVMGVGKHEMCEQAESFSTGIADVPGRMNVLSLRGGTVIFDYGHNVPALRAIIAALDVFPHRRRSALYSMAGDRRDVDIIRVGELLGDAFDSVVLYDAYTIRGRAPGEVPSLMRQGLARGSRIRDIVEIPNPVAAMKAALDAVGPGILLLLQHDDMDEALDVVRTYLDLEPGSETTALSATAGAR